MHTLSDQVSGKISLWPSCCSTLRFDPEYRDAFAMFDKGKYSFSTLPCVLFMFNVGKDDDGTITTNELGAVMHSLGQHPSVAEVNAMIKEVDINNNGKIEFNEFVKLMARQVHAAQADMELRDAFKTFDQDGNGFISAGEVRSALAGFGTQGLSSTCSPVPDRWYLGQRLTEAEVEMMIREADIDGDGHIAYDGEGYHQSADQE